MSASTKKENKMERCERQPKKIKVPLIMASGLFLMHTQFHYMQTVHNLNKIDKLQTFKLSLFKWYSNVTKFKVISSKIFFQYLLSIFLQLLHSFKKGNKSHWKTIEQFHAKAKWAKLHNELHSFLFTHFSSIM